MRKSRSSTSDASTKRRVRAVTMALVGGAFEPGDHFKLMNPRESSLGSFPSGITGVIVAPWQWGRVGGGDKRFLVRFDNDAYNPPTQTTIGTPVEGDCYRYFWVREADIKFICGVP